MRRPPSGQANKFLVMFLACQKYHEKNWWVSLVSTSKFTLFISLRALHRFADYLFFTVFAHGYCNFYLKPRFFNFYFFTLLVLIHQPFDKPCPQSILITFRYKCIQNMRCQSFYSPQRIWMLGMIMDITSKVEYHGFRSLSEQIVQEKLNHLTLSYQLCPIS